MERILKLIQKKQSTTNRPLIVGIDGRCGSGKSSLAKYLKEKLDCEVIHMDHFFLQEHQKSEFRNHIAGGNFDNERFVFEVQRPILENRDIVYKRYDCSSKSFIENISINREKLIVVEGTYSCHPSINNIYDLKNLEF